MKIQGFIPGTSHAARPGLGGILAALLAMAIMLPLVLIAFILAVVLGIAAMLSGLFLAAINRLRGAFRAATPSGRRNVRVIPPRQ